MNMNIEDSSSALTLKFIRKREFIKCSESIWLVNVLIMSNYIFNVFML